MTGMTGGFKPKKHTNEVVIKMHHKCLVITKHGTQKEIKELMEPYMEEGVMPGDYREDPRVEFIPMYSVKIARAIMVSHNKEMYAKMDEFIKLRKIPEHEYYKRYIYHDEEDFMKRWHGYELKGDQWGKYRNLEGFWDWWFIGGSWQRTLNATKGRKYKLTHRAPEGQKGFDSAKLKNIINIQELTTARILSKEFNLVDREWDVYEEKFVEYKNFDENTKNLLETLQEIRPEYWLTIVDYHN